MKQVIKTCNQCDKEFYTYPSSVGKFCSLSCRAIFNNHLRRKNKGKNTCPICGGLFEVTPQRKKYCSIKCRGIGRRVPAELKKKYIPKEPLIKKCRICGQDIISRAKNVKHCSSCQNKYSVQKRHEYWKTEQYKLAHRRCAKKWQKENEIKYKAATLAKSHPALLNIIYVCPCEAEEKHRHHFDYSKPFDVLLLCDKCHMAEHKRLRNLLTHKATQPERMAIQG